MCQRLYRESGRGSAGSRTFEGIYELPRTQRQKRQIFVVSPKCAHERPITQIEKSINFILLFYYLQNASYICSAGGVARKPHSKRRSGCPVNICLEVFGDRWSLLLVRDLMVRGYRMFKEFRESGDGIATHILSDRLQKLERAGIITAELEATDGRRVNYRLTEKGIDLAPVLLDLLIWGARHEPSGPSCSAILKMEKNREEILAEVERRWRERDSTPLIPRFDASVARNLGRTQQESLA
jgi:DNA-binding HxlR family transcriptional regulator